MSDFAVILKQLRVEKGLNQSELAERIGMSPSAINLMEAGQRKPSLSTLQDLADVLGTSIDYLVGRAPKPGDDQVPLGNSVLASMYRTLSKLPLPAQERAAGFIDVIQQQELKKPPGA